MRSASHGGKHRRKSGVAPEHFQHQKAFVRAGRRSQIVGQLNGARDAGAEPDAVVGARNVVVHGLGNRNDFKAFFVQAHAVAESVVAPDRHHVINAEPLEIFQHFGS